MPDIIVEPCLAGRMPSLSGIIWNYSARAREARARLFRSRFSITGKTRLLDLGSEDGSNIQKVLEGTPASPENIYIADIEADAVEAGRAAYGYNAVSIDETGVLPFEDNFFDIVYCSSVIEHATVPKSDIWKTTNGREFADASAVRQTAMADEIRRLGKAYFVQTPCKTFPIESHTLLPFMGYLPRGAMVSAMRLTNRFWIKQSHPDFHLLGWHDMRSLFPDAEIVAERVFGLTKSIIAIRGPAKRDRGI